MYNDVRDELAHHGILGMRWGVRRYQNKDGSLTPAGKKRAEEIAIKKEDDQIKQDRRADSRNRRRLDDKTLMERIGRLQNEKKLKDLTDEEINPGRAAAKDILKKAGIATATTVLTGGILFAVKSVIAGKFDPVDMLSYVTPKPKR